jgi:hypothetical protein
MLTKKQENKIKYLTPPPIEMIEAFISKVGVSTSQFERYFGIPLTTIDAIRRGKRKMPPKFWHIFYEAVLPSHGQVSESKQAKRIISMKFSTKPQPMAEVQKLPPTGRLASLLAKQQNSSKEQQ